MIIRNTLVALIAATPIALTSGSAQPILASPASPVLEPVAVTCTLDGCLCLNNGGSGSETCTACDAAYTAGPTSDGECNAPPDCTPNMPCSVTVTWHFSGPNCPAPGSRKSTLQPICGASATLNLPCPGGGGTVYTFDCDEDCLEK